MSQSYQRFLLALERELQKREFAVAETHFGMGETADDLAARLKKCHPDKVVWYCPQRLAREVALRLHDGGIRVIGVSDGGFPSIPCQYEICREMALKKIVAEWKRDGIRLVKVAAGPARATAREVRIAAALDELNIDLRLTHLDAQAPQRFVNGLSRGSNFGILMLDSAVSLLATRAPDALARLLNSSRVAFVDRPASLPFAKVTDATVVDLVVVDWQRVAQRIAGDTSHRQNILSQQRCVFEAAAARAVSLGQCLQGL